MLIERAVFDDVSNGRCANLFDLVRHALDAHLERLAKDSKYAPLGSFDEFLLATCLDCTIHVVSRTAGSLSQARYISGNICDQIIINPSATPLILEIYLQDFRLGDFNQAKNLLLEQEMRLQPGEQVFLEENRRIARCPKLSAGTYLSIRRPSRMRHTWMYAADDLVARYPICCDSNVAQISMLLNTFKQRRQQIPLDLKTFLSRHDSATVRWMYGEYMLTVETENAIEYYSMMSEFDGELAGKARQRLAALLSLRR